MLQNVAETLFAVIVIGVLWSVLLRMLTRSYVQPAPRINAAILQFQKEQAEAEKKAEELLREMLTPMEFMDMCRRGYLEVHSPTYHRRVYRVPRYQGRVGVFEGEKLLMELCVQPIRRMPTADVVLMHKLMIEGNEAEYLRIANRF